jgi:peptidoglycan/xylan/chitin deacetylase (PgdA/CDA1 family)
MTVRILILSDARPRRAHRIAERISSEVPDAEICGVVQHALHRLPWLQQVIATGDIDRIGRDGRVPETSALWIRRILDKMVHALLWFAHGCPLGLHANIGFTAEDLGTRCRDSSLPFLLVPDPSSDSVEEFCRRQCPNLVIVLGEPSLRRELLNVPSLGLARVLVQDISTDAKASLQPGTKLTVECFAHESDRACPLTSLILPVQIHDEPLGKILKRDLIADDLLVQAAKALAKGSVTQASQEITEWAHRTLIPYLDQLGQAPPEPISLPGRCRSIAKLCAQSLLCFPWLISRNWYRRLRSRYPVLILAHHLVSDRPHRMGMPTEDLWRRIRFLQRQYRIVSLSEASHQLASGKVSMPTAVLTFDDGYCDNYISLRAVAEETGTKIVLFLATVKVELHQEFDHDLMAGTRGFLPLTWDQVEEWSRRDVEFGSHTRTHFDCGCRERSRLEREIAESQRDLEMRLGQPCRFFAFPFGKQQNMSPEAMQIAASNYSIFLSAYGGENLPHREHGQRHLLRKGFYSDPWELELELQSVFGLVETTKVALRRTLARLRPWPLIAGWVWKTLWAFLHACLILLAILPPLRRMLDEISGDTSNTSTSLDANH